MPDVERFMSEYNMQCPMAATRLLHSGLPATIEHKTKQRSNDPESASVRCLSCPFMHSFMHSCQSFDDVSEWNLVKCMS